MAATTSAGPERKRRAKRRPDGDGSVYFDAKRGLWCAELMVGYKADGKVDKRRVTAKRQDDVRKKLDDLKTRAKSGLLGDAAAGRETVTAFFRRWLDSIDGTMEPRSLQRHRDNVGRHLIPLMGSRKLADISAQTVVTVLTALRTQSVARNQPRPNAATPAKGKSLSPRSVKYCYTTLRSALDAAVEWGSLPRNPVRSVPIPKVPRVEVSALTPDEVGTFLESATAASDPLATLFTVAVFSGLRQGELLGLWWDDVDLSDGRVSVRRTLVSWRNGTPTYGDPKTNRSRRTLKLSSDAVAALRSQRAQQAADRLLLGADYSEHNLVFATPLGTPLDPSNVRKRLKAALTRAKLTDTHTFHSLRHSAATMMLAAGISPKVAADRLGHHSAAFTMDRYVHALQSMDEDAADRLQNMVSAARKQAS